jgi:hypothetical protein
MTGPLFLPSINSMRCSWHFLCKQSHSGLRWCIRIAGRMAAPPETLVAWRGQIKARNMARQAADTNTALPQTYGRVMQWWFWLGWPAFITVIIIFWMSEFMTFVSPRPLPVLLTPSWLTTPVEVKHILFPQTAAHSWAGNWHFSMRPLRSTC